MRCFAVTIAIFINLVMFGMCSYMYLLWSQYWIFPENKNKSATSTYDQQIYLYNRGYLPTEIHNKTNIVKSRSKHQIKGNITYVKNSRPRFPSSNPNKFELDTIKYHCSRDDSQTDCDQKTKDFKAKLLMELSNTFEDESNILKYGNMNNTYNVHYMGPKENFRNKSPKQILCELLNTRLQTLKRSDIDSSEPIKSSMPKRGFFENKYFNSCAVIASSGALKNSNLGNFIDSHDVVLRFNHAPTRGFERDVGRKTTVRVLNSQVVTRREFKFLTSPLYKNITLVLWDPSNYSASLQEWMKNPEFNLFPNFIQYRKQEEKPRVFVINPLTIWDIWDFLQRNFPNRLRRNPPSSGFLGLRLLLPHCNFVDVVEYIPSTRVTKRCHYYDPEDNPACTFGVWHPLAAEKLITYHLNRASDTNVFQRGFVLGIVGVFHYASKIYIQPARSGEDFLIVATFHIIGSAVLLSGIIWEKPLIVLVYEFLHISTLVSLFVFIIIYMEKCILNLIILATLISFLSYWIFCIHLYYRQLRLKVKSNVEYIDRDVYSVCNKLYVNKYIRM